MAKKFKNIVAKQKYWDSLEEKYGPGIKYRQGYMDMYSDSIPELYSSEMNKYDLKSSLANKNIRKELPEDLGEIVNKLDSYNFDKPYVNNETKFSTDQSKKAWGDADVSKKKSLETDFFLASLDHDQLSTNQPSTNWKSILENRNDIPDKALLFASLMDEGGDRFTKKLSDEKRQGTNKTISDLDGFANFGLDRFSENVDDFIDKKYLSEDIKDRMAPRVKNNERGEHVVSSIFSNLNDVVSAKNAYMKDGQQFVNDYFEKNNIPISDKARDYFTIASYNYGKGGTRRMIDAYNKADILNEDKFMNEDSYGGYRQIHRNITRRLSSRDMLLGEGIVDNKPKHPAPLRPTPDMVKSDHVDVSDFANLKPLSSLKQSKNNSPQLSNGGQLNDMEKGKKTKKRNYLFPENIESHLSDGVLNRYKAKASQGALAAYGLNKKHGKEEMDRLRLDMQEKLRSHPDNDGTIAGQQKLLEEIASGYSKNNPDFAIPSDSISNYYTQPQIDLYYQNEDTLSKNLGDNVTGVKSDKSAIGYRNFVSNMLNEVRTSQPYLPELTSPGYENRREYTNHGLEYNIDTQEYSPTKRSLGTMENPEYYKNRSQGSIRATPPQEGSPRLANGGALAQSSSTGILNPNLPTFGYGGSPGASHANYTDNNATKGAIGAVGAVNPIIGGIAALGESMVSPLEQSMMSMNSEGSFDNRKQANAAGILRGTLDPFTAGMRAFQDPNASVAEKIAGATGTSALFTNKRNDRMEAEAKSNIAKQESVDFAQRERERLAMGNSQNGTQNFALGGSLNGLGQNKLSDGGLEEYDGQTHQGPQGGIPVSASGSPATITGEAPVGLVEDNENGYTDPKTGKVMILSDKLTTENGDTFAEAARKINKRFYS